MGLIGFTSYGCALDTIVGPENHDCLGILL
jgi:hypothetical protein